MAPTIWVCSVLIVGLSEPLGIMPPYWAWLLEWGVVAGLALLSLGHALRRIPDRFVQLASHTQLWLCVLIPILGLYATKQEVYGTMLIVLVASSGTLMQRKLTLFTIAAIAAMGTVLLVRAHGPFAWVYISALLFAAVGAVIVHMLMSRALVRAAQLSDVANEAARELAQRLDELQRAEAERARLQDQLLHSQRMEAVGTLAAGIAHDMNNVLASISSLAALTLDEHDRSVVREDLERIIAQTERGAALTRGLLAFSRRGQYRKRRMSLWDVVRQLIPILERTLPKSIGIRSELPTERVCVLADPAHFEQVLVNLALNARDAMRGTGRLWIRGTVTPEARAQLRVTDSGEGMDSATRLRVFEPFFTTKALGKGTGRGRSTVWGIVQAHDGTITVESQPGSGATFTIELPTTDAHPSVRLSSPRLSTADVIGSELQGKVMVVDDEAAVRNTSKRLLQRMGLDVITAENGQDALDKFDASIQLVVLDMGMPVMGGAECFRRLRETSNVPILIATGYAIDEEAQAMVAQGAALLEKPFSAHQLRQEVSRLLARARSRDANAHE